MVKPFSAVPSVKGLPLINYSVFGKYNYERLHEAKQENYKRYGPLYKERVGPGINLVHVFRPEDISEVFRNDGKYPLRPSIPILLTAHKRDGIPLGMGSLNGEQWFHARQCVHKHMMVPHAALRYLDAQVGVADDFVDVIRSGGITADNFQEMLTRYAIESIGVVCFGKRLGCLQRDLPPNHKGQRMFYATTNIFQALQKTTFAFPWHMMFRTPLYRQLITSKKISNSIAAEYMHLLNSESVNHQDDVPEHCTFLQSLHALPNISPKQIHTVTTELFTAGIDSTANALSFVLYNLSTNPEKQQKLRQEICKVLEDRQHRLDGQALEDMKYLKACVRESFRINFPVEGGPARITSKDLVLNDYEIPKGTILTLNNQTICLDSKYFEQPHKYIPERWLKVKDKADESQVLQDPPKFVMLPFGYGSRMCIGRRFAEQEIYLATIKILKSFQLDYMGTGKVGMLNRVFTTPDQPIKIHFSPVDD